MFLIVGLGNPGEKFKNTRHNVGFSAIDFFAEKNNFPDFKLDKKSDSLISEKDNILLAKPQTFMNNSGSAVKKLSSQRSRQTIIVHDEADLPAGKIKIINERGSAGHKGVESIIKAVGNENLIRIRIGIEGKKTMEAEKIVLKKFGAEEKEAISQALSKTADAINCIIDEGPEMAMNKFN